MTNQQIQIVKAYEDIHMSLEDIALEHELESMEVKAVLMQFSPVYKELIKTEDGSGEDFTNEEALLAKKVMVNMMEEASADPEKRDLAFRIAKYIRNDKKGRLDRAKGFAQLNVGVGLFNEQLRKMEDAIERVKLVKGSDKTIDVKSSKSNAQNPGPAPQLLVDAVEGDK